MTTFIRQSRKMKNQKQETPLDIRISFKKLVDTYAGLLESDDQATAERAQRVMAIAEKNPKLLEGFNDFEAMQEYQNEIDVLLKDSFAEVLGKNEIKVATIPFQETVFKSSPRYDTLIANAGSGFIPEIVNFDKDQYYIMGCSIILNQHYGYNLDFRRPFYYDIPDINGNIRNYKILYNADFISIEKTDKAKEISKEDVSELLDNFDKVSLWKEKFPPKSWLFKGFVIANMYDATVDVALSDFKANLLRDESEGAKLSVEFEKIFRKIFNVSDLKLGFSDYNKEEGSFEQLLFKNLKSYILNGRKSQESTEALCSASYYTLFKQKEFYCISNTIRYHEMYPDNIMYKKLMDQGINSAIFAAITNGDKVLGVLELVSSQVNALNSINANKLRDIMPYLSDSVHRSKENLENELELIIQEECTSIHKSVHWKFRKEAKRVLTSIAQERPTYFKEIVFDDVYPLYGQMDIKGSSQARNVATQKDLLFQLQLIQRMVKKIHTIESLPIYEQMDYKISDYLDELEHDLQVDSERQVLNFVRKEIVPLFGHLSKKSDVLKELIKEYYDEVEENTGLVYKNRKDYDESVMEINKRMATTLDRKQREAQRMYPHYFERFKTDGVEHNMYIGEAITKDNSFHKVYLYNLRLWQLQVMCEMENVYYKLKPDLAMPLDVASMILSFNTPLALRFRMDEKRFDVDGTYNARYEVIKKRVDKANIKGTEERVTQPGKISIIYSQKEDETEYLKYIAFLQRKRFLDSDVEILELEDLQGVTGLKAIRVSILYASNNKDKEYYTYEDLMSQLTE